jgi:hypothetical protein
VLQTTITITIISMLIETFPDELVHRIVAELHSDIAADKVSYESRRWPETREAGIHWTHGHLVPLSVINRQSRRVSLPRLFESVDIVCCSFGGEGVEVYCRYFEWLIEPLVSKPFHSHISTAIRWVSSQLVGVLFLALSNQVNRRINVVSHRRESYNSLDPDYHPFTITDLYKCTHYPLMDVLASLPNLQVLSGLHRPSEKFVTAISSSSLLSFKVSGYIYHVVPVERNRNNPDILRKLCIQEYCFGEVKSIEWLNAAGTVSVDRLDITDLQISRRFLDQPPTILSLKSIKVQINNNNYHEATGLTESLMRYILGSGQGVICVCFDAYNLSEGFKRIPSMPLIGSLLDVFSSDEDLYRYELGRATQQLGFNSSWNTWKIISLKVVSCPSDQNFLKALSERAAFLETLDIQHINEDELSKQWGRTVLSTVCVPFFFVVQGTHREV